MNYRINARRLAITGCIAALYVALTMGLPMISYGPVQFRISEALNLLALIDPIFGLGVIVGCLISNCFSPLGPIDVFVGTIATTIGLYAMIYMHKRTGNLIIASLCPMFANILVAFELTFVFSTPLIYNIFTIFIGEFVVITCIGCPLFVLLQKNQPLMRLMKPSS